ncbi:unnamed protein product, partial [marine sediment metagenome]
TVEDVDKLPLEDYGPENHFTIMGDGQIKPLKVLPEYENPRGDTKNSIFYIASRGCPYSCSYCQEPFYQEIINVKKRVRIKSVEKVIEDLKYLKNKYLETSKIYFLDPDFFVKTNDWLSKFAQKYTKYVQKPFWAFANPFSITSEKAHILSNAGLNEIQIGIQSGSERTNRELYNRRFSEEKLLESIKIFQELDVGVWLDIIYDNPWERKEDLEKTINLIERFPKPFKLGTFALSFFEKTPLYEKALKEGIQVLRKDESLNFHTRKSSFNDNLNEIIRQGRI